MIRFDFEESSFDNAWVCGCALDEASNPKMRRHVTVRVTLRIHRLPPNFEGAWNVYNKALSALSPLQQF